MFTLKPAPFFYCTDDSCCSPATSYEGHKLKIVVRIPLRKKNNFFFLWVSWGIKEDDWRRPHCTFWKEVLTQMGFYFSKFHGNKIKFHVGRTMLWVKKNKKKLRKNSAAGVKQRCQTKAVLGNATTLQLRMCPYSWLINRLKPQVL